MRKKIQNHSFIPWIKLKTTINFFVYNIIYARFFGYFLKIIAQMITQKTLLLIIIIIPCSISVEN